MATQHAILAGSRVDLQGDRLFMTVPIGQGQINGIAGTLVFAQELAVATLASMGIGQNSLFDLTTGKGDTAVGNNVFPLLTTGSRNTGLGGNGLTVPATGVVGGALTTQNDNTFIGFAVGGFCTSSTNTGVGSFALSQVTTGNALTACGMNAGKSATTNNGSCYFGKSAGQNDIGTNNNHFGLAAGFASNSALAVNNCYYGSSSGNANTAGFGNSGFGNNTLLLCLTGSNNTCAGFGAGSAYTGAESGNILVGQGVNGTVGESNI